MCPFQCDEYAHCCDLVDFAIEMRQKLEEINKHSFNRFQLRIGMHAHKSLGLIAFYAYIENTTVETIGVIFFNISSLF